MRQSRKHLAKTSLFGCTKFICYLHNSHLYTTGGWYEFNNFVLQWNRLNAQRSKLTCFSNLHRSEVSCPGQNCEELWQAGVSQVKLVVKNPPANAGDVRDVGSILGSGRSPGGQHGNPLWYSCLQNPRDREAWRATVHRVTKSQVRLKWLSTHILDRWKGDLWDLSVSVFWSVFEFWEWLSPTSDVFVSQ